MLLAPLLVRLTPMCESCELVPLSHMELASLLIVLTLILVCLMLVVVYFAARLAPAPEPCLLVFLTPKAEPILLTSCEAPMPESCLLLCSKTSLAETCLGTSLALVLVEH